MRLLMGEEVFRHPLPRRPQEIPAWRRWLDFSRVNEPLPEGVSWERIALAGPGGAPLFAEVYRPQRVAAPPPLLYYLHGGGWCVGSAASVRRLGMLLASGGRVVVSLDYRLAPEAPYPAAVEDCLAGAWWCAANAQSLGARDGDLLIAGDSAGANLAAVTLLVAADPAVANAGARDVWVPDGPPPRFGGAVFSYGVFDFPLLMQEPGRYQGAVEVRYNLAYLGNDFLAHHWSPTVSPLRGDLRGFPPSYLTCGASDDLLGQSLAMAAALARASVATQLSVVPGMDHAFLQLDGEFPQARAELARIDRWLHETSDRTTPR